VKGSKVSVERRDIINSGIDYFVKMRKVRLDLKTVLRIDETWVDSSLTFRNTGKDMEFNR
jgi:hypothetical protein